MRELRYIFVFLSFFMYPSFVFATVFEFNEDGTVNEYEAQDYLSVQRHRGLNRPVLRYEYPGKYNRKFEDLVSKAAEKYNISANLIHAVIRAESSYNPDAVSLKGAGGLMQLMPATARRFDVEDRFSPEENINGGAQYLKFLLGHYHGDVTLAVAAYNAGEGAVDRYGDVPPYAETRAYVERVVSYLDNQQASNE